MIQRSGPIGVIDSGVGGLTAVRQLQYILPGEDIVFFGDSANCPYGNRSSDEIFEFAMRMLRFMEAQEVKCVAIACNTISSIADRLRPQFSFPIVSIVESGARFIARRKLSRVGLIATEFTVSAGAYDRHIHSEAPDCLVVAKGSPDLAALIDRGDFNQAAIEGEITRQVDDILAREPVEDLLLGCTHFPIVAENFRRCYPRLRLIDPAEQQASDLRGMLVYRRMTNTKPRGGLTINTSGDPELYDAIAKRLNLSAPYNCKAVSLQ